MIQRSSYSKLLITFFSIVMLTMGIMHSVYAEQQTNFSKMEGKVIEIIDVKGYTYAQIDAGKTKVWAAGPTTALTKGDKVAFSTAMPMKDFHSESMQRDFPLIYFIGRFETESDKANKSTMPAAHGKINQVSKPIKGIEKVDGGKNIAEIHTQKEALKGKIIQVRGQVTRFAADIMGKNWLHIQDSSSFDDLTVTTDNIVAVGDTVIIEGQLELDKDYDYGYLYPVIILDAKVTKE